MQAYPNSVSSGTKIRYDGKIFTVKLIKRVQKGWDGEEIHVETIEGSTLKYKLYDYIEIVS